MRKKIMASKIASDSKWIYLLLILISLTFLIPLLYIISLSFQNDMQVREYGYRLIPKKIDFTAYVYIFHNRQQIMDSYLTTIFYSVTGTFLSVVIMALISYPLSQSNFRFRKPITFIVFFTMLFSGGLVPSYILITQYLHLSNNIWVYIVPGLANAFNILLFRTYFLALPFGIIEAARMDGASEWKILFQIVMPLSTPAIAIVSLFGLLARWNDFFTSMLYIQNQKLYSLQYLLQKILMDGE